MIRAAFRFASSADIPALHGLIERSYRGDSARRGWTHEADLLGGQRTDAEALGELVADPLQRMILAEAGGALVGCVQIAKAMNDTAYLGHLSVDPDHQAAGLGRQLLTAAESVAAEVFGARFVEMTVIAQRVELIDWYGRRGYAATGEVRPFPLDDVRFGVAKTRDLEFVVLARALS